MSLVAEAAEASSPSQPPTHSHHYIHSSSYHHFSQQETQDIRTALLSWYQTHRRKLPWRGDTPPYSTTTTAATTTAATTTTTTTTTTSASSSSSSNSPTNSKSSSCVSAYGVWVSEVMLQQTRVETVIDYYNKWMSVFPSISVLSSASLDEVNRVWSGLGYYRRARFLHAAAQQLTQQNKSRNMEPSLPQSVNALLEIAGIGPYTAGAIASIAFQQRTPTVDGNIIRVLSRIRALHVDPKHTQHKAQKTALYWHLADVLVDPVNPGDFNQSMMELGAVICTPTSPQCLFCPVQRFCHAYAEVQTQQRPVMQHRQQKALVDSHRQTIEIEIQEDDDDDDRADTDADQTHDHPPSKKQRIHIKATLRKKDQQRQMKGNKKQNKQNSVAESSFHPDPGFLRLSPAIQLRVHLSVCVLMRYANSATQEIEYFMVKRPDTGLLAGQWEFPSCRYLPLSANSTDTHQQQQVMDQYLQQLFPSPLSVVNRTQLGSCTHLFSHRRHLMHIESMLVQNNSSSCCNHGNGSSGNNQKHQTQRMRWCCLQELEEIGLTSGQHKILQISSSHVNINSSHPSSHNHDGAALRTGISTSPAIVSSAIVAPVQPGGTQEDVTMSPTSRLRVSNKIKRIHDVAVVVDDD